MIYFGGKPTFSPIRHFAFKYVIFTDASLTGWGAVCETKRVNGFWTLQEKSKHINYPELLAVFFALKCLASNWHDCHILLRIDNTTAISYINRMGGIQYPEFFAGLKCKKGQVKTTEGVCKRATKSTNGGQKYNQTV